MYVELIKDNQLASICTRLCVQLKCAITIFFILYFVRTTKYTKFIKKKYSTIRSRMRSNATAKERNNAKGRKKFQLSDHKMDAIAHTNTIMCDDLQLHKDLARIMYA